MAVEPVGEGLDRGGDRGGSAVDVDERDRSAEVRSDAGLGEPDGRGSSRRGRSARPPARSAHPVEMV